MKAKIVTRAEEIVDYWSARVSECDMGVDWSEAHERCWRCGDDRSLERFHIIPAQEPFCGPDSPENFVLLCKRCHAEAPSCVDTTEIWNWIKITNAGLYGIYWEQRDWEEIKRVYKLNLERELLIRDTSACLSEYKQIFEKEVGVHLGLRPFSVASKAYVWRKVLSQVPPLSS